LAILKEEGQGGSLPTATGVFHCFTETREVAEAALDLGFYISFSGILTFKTAADLREIAAWVPMDRMLIETDSPYLAPVPHRGKTNSPALVPFVAAQIATTKRVPLDQVAHVTAANVDALFTRIAGAQGAIAPVCATCPA
jgi:TatD DNase family protein